MSLSTEPPIPWHLICREAVRGASVEGLSRRFNVSPKQIEEHLARAIKITPEGNRVVRTSVEINKASMQARSDLIDVLQQAISELVASDKPRLTQLNEFNSLLESAARLFHWPKAVVMRIAPQSPAVTGYGPLNGTLGASASTEGPPTEAVNLALIATSPEQLAALAQQQQKVAETPPGSVES